MSAFYDQFCLSCGQKNGWHGEMKDRPKCPRCGCRLLDVEFAADEAEINRFRELIGKRKRKEKLTDDDKSYIRGQLS